MTDTPSTQRLAEQRERHARYRRFVEREPEINGSPDVWTPTGAGDQTISIHDPHQDYERRLRDLADDLLDDDDGAARAVLDGFISKTETDDLARAFPQDQHVRLVKLLGERGPQLEAIREDRKIAQRLQDAMHAIFYADLIAAGTQPQAGGF